jgi:peptidoglycan/xylan/chitin deacetylase (PgdA/CDA1 family)
MSGLLLQGKIKVLFVTSWDDGHPLDLRIAELLRKYDLSGSFFVPINNREGRKVMTDSMIRDLDLDFEVGSHTLDHVYLTDTPYYDAVNQIIQGKEILEDILGCSVNGFCYPGGKINKNVKNAVIAAGFEYARGINNLWGECGNDVYDIKTTLQFYPHDKGVLLRNYIFNRSYSKRFPVLNSAFSSNDWLALIIRLIDNYAETNIIFHLWGHSWEVDDCGLWDELEMVFSHVKSTGSYSSSILEMVNGKLCVS